MSWYPSRISTRLTIGGILLLAVTTAIIIVVMLWRGQPRVVEINTALIEETGRGLTSRVSTILSQTDGKTVSLARLAEVLPNDEALYRYIPPNLIESNSLITGGGIWPEPGAFTPGIEKRSFFWARNPAGELVFLMSTIQRVPVIITMKAGTGMPVSNPRKAVCGLMFTAMPFPV